MKRSIFFFICVVLFSCSSDDSISSSFDIGYEYFPIRSEGSSYLYEVERIFYNNEGKEIDTQSVFQREDASTPIFEKENLGSFRLDIWESKSGQEPWLFQENVISEINNLQAISFELESRVVSLTFPLVMGKEWDGLALMGSDNVKNIHGEEIEFFKNWTSKVIDFGSYDDFSDVVTIQQADYENDLERRYSIEKYARGVGLIYKEQMILDTQCLTQCEGQTWEQKAHHGMILKKRLVSVN